MHSFKLCSNCNNEYTDMHNRRFHAQTTSCPICGPRLFYYPDLDNKSKSEFRNDKILDKVAENILGGSVCVIKATGGFHLVCDASNNKAVATIRQIKQRPEKPFAVMFSTIEDIEQNFLVNQTERSALLSSARPIVLLKTKLHPDETSFASMSTAPKKIKTSMKTGETLAYEVNRAVQHTGVFLPDSALYTLLLGKLNTPIVATSCNVSGEPLITTEREFHNALERGTFKHQDNKISLLTHNREILNRCDDSVLSYVETLPIPIRNAKGIAPFVQKLPFKTGRPTLALGAQQKSSITLATGNEAIMSPHLGDLFTLPYEEAFDALCRQMMRQYRFTPEVIICDANPSYYSHQYGKQLLKQFNKSLYEKVDEQLSNQLSKQSVDHLDNNVAKHLSEQLDKDHNSQWIENYANRNSIQFKMVYHHHAHAMSLMAEHNFSKNEKLITAVWDGAGMGPDRTTWGGEILNAGYQDFERLSHFRSFYQLGGETGAKYPYKTAASILFEVYGQDAKNHCPHVWNHLCPDIEDKNNKHPDQIEQKAQITNRQNTTDQITRMPYGNLFTAWSNKTNMGLSTSAGRLFDAAASILNICHVNTYEAEAAIKLEDMADINYTNYMTLDITEASHIATKNDHTNKTKNQPTPKAIDWRPLFEELTKINDPAKGAAFFINTMAQLLIAISNDYDHLGLTGGVFQNRKLLYRALELSTKQPIKLYLHEKFPCNDGGISLGQVLYLGE